MHGHVYNSTISQQEQTRESKVSLRMAIPAKDEKEKEGTSYPMQGPLARGNGWSKGAF
jgi:hypothetical protein